MLQWVAISSSSQISFHDPGTELTAPAAPRWQADSSLWFPEEAPHTMRGIIVHVRLFELMACSPQTLSMKLSGQEYWSG